MGGGELLGLAGVLVRRVPKSVRSSSGINGTYAQLQGGALEKNKPTLCSCGISLGNAEVSKKL